VLGVAGTSASARLSLRTELARTLQKTVTFAALAFLDLPFRRSYFELASCPSTRAWSYAENPFIRSRIANCTVLWVKV
jgi:hypothetical protein